MPMMPRTLDPVQEHARILSSIKPKEYESYVLNPLSSGAGYYEIDVGADLKDKYSSEWRVPCNNGFILTSKNLQLKFNDESEDLITIDVSKMGTVWSFSKGDLLIDKIFLKRPYSESDQPVVRVFVSGSKLIHLAESP